MLEVKQIADVFIDLDSGSLPSFLMDQNESKSNKISVESVESLTSEQLSQLFKQREITDEIINWMIEKKINGEKFINGGEKIIARLRKELSEDEEYNIDAVDRLYKSIQKCLKMLLIKK